MADTILLTLSFDQHRKLLIYVGFGSVFALEKSKIITLYKRSAYCFFDYIILHLSGCFFLIFVILIALCHSLTASF